MRVAVVTRHGRRIGGVETYVSYVNRELAAAGHEVAFVSEFDVPVDRAPVTTAGETVRWCVADQGSDQTLARLTRWAPDVIYSHGLNAIDFEEAMPAIAPTVFHAHNYYGTCISGAKMYAKPRRVPCRRRFGVGCLALYYPRRCGGWHPATLWRDFRRQRRRLVFLRRCAAIVAGSRYVADEYAKHTVRERVFTLPLPVGGDPVRAVPRRAAAMSSGEWRLLWLGRMDPLKGGDMLLDSLPAVAAAAQRPVVVVFAGDGPARERWQAHAQRLEATVKQLTIRFVGWVEPDRRADLFAHSDLLVLPSVWPEPFGLVGPEAARHGIPTAAFDVGGISEWLSDGVSGRLASGSPPTSRGLAAAIVGCLGDPQTYGRLCAGAAASADRFRRDVHIRALCDILSVASRSRVDEATR